VDDASAGFGQDVERKGVSQKSPAATGCQSTQAKGSSKVKLRAKIIKSISRSLPSRVTAAAGRQGRH